MRRLNRSDCLKHTNTVANCNSSRLKYLRGNSAMTSHGIVGVGPKDFSIREQG